MFCNRLAVVAGVTVAALSAVHAEDLPARKSGLWESSMTIGDGNLPVRMKQCIDAQTDKALMGTANGLCDMTWKRTAGDRIETETTCKMGPVTASGKGVITGDFSSAVRVETTTTTTASGEGMPAGAPKLNIPPVTQTLVVEAKWLGPCEAGQKPGDFIAPDGKVMQMPMHKMPKF